MDLILAFDLGTSSVRTALFTTEPERLVATTARESYPIRTTPDGGAEIAHVLLRAAVLRCLTATLQAKRLDPELAGGKIVGIGMSCFWHSLIGIGKNNTALTPVITWADSRCRSDAAALREEFDERDTHARTGCMLRASFWPAKLVWLGRTAPTLFKQVRLWLSPGEWIQREFCGEVCCSYSMASGTGLFNPAKLSWVSGLLDSCGIEARQLGVVGDEPAVLLPSWESEYPELAGVPWYPAIGDGAASNLGSGATQPGLAAINVGTSAALRVVTEGKRVRAPFGLFCYRVDSRRYLIGGAVSNAGNLRAWCLREWKLPEDPEEIERQLQMRPVPGHRLIVLPFWTAERAPTWRDDLAGAIVGLTQATTAMDVLQATTEAVYYRIARIAEMLKANELPLTFIVSGGIEKSPSSIRRLANILDSSVYPNSEPEASLRGAAVFVAEKLGHEVAPFKGENPVTPRRLAAAVYREYRKAQTKLEALLGG